MNHPDHDPVDDLIRAARRDVRRPMVEEASAEMARAIARTPRSRRLRGRAAAAALVAAVVAVPTAAAAYVWSTHTGVFGQPDRSTEVVDGSEWLDLCAPDFRAEAEGLAPARLPLPPGLTLATVQEELFGTRPPECSTVGGRAQATGIARSYENFAWCSWVHRYVDHPGDRSAAARALKRLANSELARTVDREGDVIAQDNEIADAAAAGQLARVVQEQQVNCADFGWRA